MHQLNTMHSQTESVALLRDVDAAVVPSGTSVTLQKGETAHITQSLGGTYTVIVNGNMFRIDGHNADALGKENATAPAGRAVKAATREELEVQVWTQLKTCYDPEIPVNIVDLGLIYDCHLTALTPDSYKAEIKMTLTAPGCGMGPSIKADVENKLLCLDGVAEAHADLVWDPPWSREMMSEAARLELGMM